MSNYQFSFGGKVFKPFKLNLLMVKYLIKGQSIMSKLYQSISGQWLSRAEDFALDWTIGFANLVTVSMTLLHIITVFIHFLFWNTAEKL